jgi:hypothetical protein
MKTEDFNASEVKPAIVKTIDFINQSQGTSDCKNNFGGVSPNSIMTDATATRLSSSHKFSEVYARMQEFQARHNLILQKNIEKYEEKQKLLYTHTPKLNEKSKKLIKNVSPLHLRYENVIKNKQDKIKELITKSKSQKEKEINKELTFKPKILDTSSTVRTSEEYFNYMKSWIEYRERVDKRERERKEEKIFNDITFQPKLNKKSEILVKNLPDFETRVEKGIQNKQNKLEEKRTISP